jgi:hypothetical protein
MGCATTTRARAQLTARVEDEQAAVEELAAAVA